MIGLADVVIDGDGKGSVVSVGAGAKWLDVYTYLDARGLAVAGGRNGAVGAGGLLLGGGISHFSPRVGFACDNVINYEVAAPPFSIFPSSDILGCPWIWRNSKCKRDLAS